MQDVKSSEEFEYCASNLRLAFDIQSRSLGTCLSWALISTPTTKASLYVNWRCSKKETERVQDCIKGRQLELFWSSQ